MKMDVTGWDDRNFHMLHTFIVADRIVAEGTSKGVIYSKREGVIPPEKVLEAVEQYVDY